jgi:hypothetical protein
LNLPLARGANQMARNGCTGKGVSMNNLVPQCCEYALDNLKDRE